MRSADTSHEKRFHKADQKPSSYIRLRKYGGMEQNLIYDAKWGNVGKEFIFDPKYGSKK